ncbi:MAG: ATP synthase F0 subunit B [Deltaproteobacteria bacterium]|nr:ATP synthase F0 subunit B [Deltaproteobacteria bacterium]
MNYLDSPYLLRIFDLGLLHLELNSFLFVLVLVLVSMLFLNVWLFKPVLRTLENRAALKKSLEEGISGGRDTIAELRVSYEKDLVRLREEVAQLRTESHKEAQKAVTEILEGARKEGQQEFRRASEILEREMGDARKQLGGIAKSLAELTMGRLLGA